MSQPQPTDAPAVPTALVVDDSAAARRRIATLLELGGWRVHQAIGTGAALRIAAVVEPDLVVTDMTMRQGHGATLMRRLRENGSRARFLVTSSRRTRTVCAMAANAGAVACLEKPVDPRLFLDVMRGLAPTPPVTPPRPAVAVPEADLMQRAQDLYASALPHRLASIATGAREGDAVSVAAEAEDLAVLSDRLGHAEVASACAVIADDARRGVVPQARLMELVRVCSRVDASRQAVAAQV